MFENITLQDVRDLIALVALFAVLFILQLILQPVFHAINAASTAMNMALATFYDSQTARIVSFLPQNRLILIITFFISTFANVIQIAQWVKEKWRY